MDAAACRKALRPFLSIGIVERRGTQTLVAAGLQGQVVQHLVLLANFFPIFLIHISPIN